VAFPICPHGLIVLFVYRYHHDANTRKDAAGNSGYHVYLDVNMDEIKINKLVKYMQVQQVLLFVPSLSLFTHTSA
jgi:hypothetical protein